MENKPANENLRKSKKNGGQNCTAILAEGKALAQIKAKPTPSKICLNSI
jgi:hypothetical protein